MSALVPRSILGLTAAGFVGFGLAFAIRPEAMARVVEISLPTATSKIDFVATYGGFELGFGIFLLLCLRRAGWLEAGLWAGGLALAGFAALRLISLVLLGLPVRPAIYIALALELSGVVLNWWGLRVARRSRAAAQNRLRM